MRGTAGLYVAVAAGSALGGVLRYLASLLIQGALGAGVALAPMLATLFVNVAGSFIIGFYAALTRPESRVRAGTHAPFFVMAGFCGGFTTFSAFSLETLRLAQAGQLGAAAVNIGLSVVTWLLAVWLGYALATRRAY